MFEIEWAKYIGTKYAIAVSSGTSAPIAGPITNISTSNAIVLSGLSPVYPIVPSVADVSSGCFGRKDHEALNNNMQKESDYRQNGGKFILPIPEPWMV